VKTLFWTLTSFPIKSIPNNLREVVVGQTYAKNVQTKYYHVMLIKPFPSFFQYFSAILGLKLMVSLRENLDFKKCVGLRFLIENKPTNADIECWRTFREFRVLSIKSNLHIFGAYDIPRAYLCRISRSWKYDSNSVLRPILSLRVLTLALMFTLMHSHTAHLSDKLQIFLKLQKFLKFSLRTPWKKFKIFQKN